MSEPTFSKSLLIPLAVFFVMVVFLGLGFGLKDPHLLPSALINKPFPEFELRDLHNLESARTKADIVGEVALVNVWGTWCPNCVVEHPELMRISQDESVPLYGVNYNDDPVKAVRWLQRYKDPFQFSVVDDKGTLAIDLGVYGAPETFVIDRKGVIRFRHVGPVNRQIFDEQFLPIIEHLQDNPDA